MYCTLEVYYRSNQFTHDPVNKKAIYAQSFFNMHTHTHIWSINECKPNACLLFKNCMDYIYTHSSVVLTNGFTGAKFVTKNKIKIKTKRRSCYCTCVYIYNMCTKWLFDYSDYKRNERKSQPEFKQTMCFQHGR